ncbi:MAG: MBL fold metallo-hydrolase [Pseudomonadota bacterium]
MTPEIIGLFDQRTNTVSYIIADKDKKVAAVIDPVWDFDAASGRLFEESVERIDAILTEQSLALEWILETHPHADHLSGAQRLKDRQGGLVGIGRGICQVQERWREIYHLGPELACDGSQFDRLFDDGETIEVGGLTIEVMTTPGHTPACVSYRAGDGVFVGDVIFMPDFGSARADFPDGDARQLYRSAQRLLALPEETRMFVGHDYGPGGREIAWETSVAAQRRDNKHLRDGTAEDAFVAQREARDRELSTPALLLPALQVNIRGGHLPKAEADGRCYLKIPVDGL